MCFWLLFQSKQRLAKGFWWIGRAASHDVPLWQIVPLIKFWQQKMKEKTSTGVWIASISKPVFSCYHRNPQKIISASLTSNATKHCISPSNCTLVESLWKQSLFIAKPKFNGLYLKKPSLLKQIQSKLKDHILQISNTVWNCQLKRILQ